MSTIGFAPLTGYRLVYQLAAFLWEVMDEMNPLSVTVIQYSIVSWSSSPVPIIRHDYREDAYAIASIKVDVMVQRETRVCKGAEFGVDTPCPTRMMVSRVRPIWRPHPVVIPSNVQSADRTYAQIRGPTDDKDTRGHKPSAHY